MENSVLVTFGHKPHIVQTTATRTWARLVFWLAPDALDAGAMLGKVHGLIQGTDRNLRGGFIRYLSWGYYF